MEVGGGKGNETEMGEEEERRRQGESNKKINAHEQRHARASTLNLPAFAVATTPTFACIIERLI